MRFLGLAALIGLSLYIIGASAASADQCPQKESPIRTDRPDVTNSSVRCRKRPTEFGIYQCDTSDQMAD